MLENKTALVTGASRGIGRAIALALAAQGAAVVVNYNGSGERAQEVVDTIKAQGGQASLYQCSVGDFQACQEMIQHVIKEYGHLDILVNNAGITRDNPLENSENRRILPIWWYFWHQKKQIILPARSSVWMAV